MFTLAKIDYVLVNMEKEFIEYCTDTVAVV